MNKSEKKKRSPIAKKEADMLRALYHLNGQQRLLLLRKADSRTIRCICECALNILLGNVALSKKEKDHLRRYAVVLRQLADRKKTKEKKKKILVQHGGGAFLPALLLPIITTVIDQLL